VEEFKSFTNAELFVGYIGEAAWFWFDASTEVNRLGVGLHRLVARCIYDEIRRRGLAEPGSDLVYAHACRTFPPDDLRPRHHHDFQSHLDTSPSPSW
jgi:hypothetical protein